MAADKMDDTNKDPAIKLFGKKIPVPADGEDSAGRSSDESEREDSNYGDGEIEKEKADKGCLAEEANDTKQEALLVDEEKGQSPEKEITNSKEKPLKKPDKILPCPRCNSMDTKFCYYNNYNVNQPRHFCRACQRYWTAGGTMRNVPVGAGRRKTKNSSLHYTHITISEAFQAVQIDTTDGVHHPAVKSNGGVLSFGLNSPVCESMASVPCIGDKKVLNGTQNGFHKEKVMAAAGKVSENVDCCSNSTCSQEPGTGNPTSFNSPVPCLPGFWPYPCHSAESAGVFYPAGFPVQLYPAAYWNWGFSVPFLSPDSCSSQKASDPSSPKLGKHSREDCLKPGDSETEKSPKQKNGSVLIPKTLRIDDPDEAAKSSIWETLGIKNESLSGGIFRGFKSKSDGKKTCVGETSPVLLANPAALCRSMRFQESS